MATKWSKKKVNPDNINSGNEYEKGDRVSVQALNSMVESGLYSQEFAEAIADTPDTSEAGNVGTPAVSFVDNVKNGNTYKKFKFSNLKGETGAKIVSTEFQGQDANGGNIYKQTFDNGSTAIFTAPKGAKGDSGSPYANTSEGQISGLNLNSSSTLADLATQLLAVQTRVVSAPIGNNITSANATALRRLLGGAPFNGTYERVEFKVFSQVTGFEKIIDVVGLKQSTSTPKIVHGQLVYNDAGESYEWQWTGWSTEPHPVGSIYQSTSSTSPSSLFGGTWEQIKDVFLLAAGDTYTVGSTGGSANAVVVSHEHNLQMVNNGVVQAWVKSIDGQHNVYGYATTSLSGNEGWSSTPIIAYASGESGTGKNMPPYLTVYVWKRIA